jgi:hypothetical protein
MAAAVDDGAAAAGPVQHVCGKAQQGQGWEVLAGDGATGK